MSIKSIDNRRIVGLGFYHKIVKKWQRLNRPESTYQQDEGYYSRSRYQYTPVCTGCCRFYRRRILTVAYIRQPTLYDHSSRGFKRRCTGEVHRPKTLPHGFLTCKVLFLRLRFPGNSGGKTRKSTSFRSGLSFLLFICEDNQTTRNFSSLITQ